MKYIIFILIFSLLFIGIPNANACWHDSYEPSAYFMYRVESDVLDNCSNNCKVWQSETSQQILETDIYELVYKYSVEQMDSLKAKSSSNKFAKWLLDNNDRDAINLLKLAKECEKIRMQRSSPWYYSSPNDSTIVRLREIAKEAASYNKDRLYGRYIIQALRAMFSLAMYEECLNLWSVADPRIKNLTMRKIAVGYVAGAYFRVGDKENAMKYYAYIGDTRSLIYCTKMSHKNLSKIEVLKLLYKYSPESDAVTSVLQEIIRELEYHYKGGDCEYWDEYYKPSLVELSDFAKEVIPTAKNRALWSYTAAQLSDMLGNIKEALLFIEEAESAETSEFLAESIKIMRIYLDSKEAIYDNKYNSKLLKELKWLDSLIVNNLSDFLKENPNYIHSIRNNYSIYYYYDMMRKIVVGEVFPRMMESGQTNLAIQLLNMAEYRLLRLDAESKNIQLNNYPSDDRYNCIEFYTDYFNVLNLIPTEKAIEYYNFLHKKKYGLASFIDDKVIIDFNYINDIIGTKLLREMKYQEAVKYLERIPSSYQEELNTSYYMTLDPFQIEKTFILDISNYKLNFANKMEELSTIMTSSSNPNDRANAIFTYAVGLKNSVNNYCWPLCFYKRSMYVLEDQSSVINRAMKTYDTLISEALNTYTNEQSAAHTLRLLHQYATAVRKYPNTTTANILRAACDNLYDY